ncbi:hypothetical protein LTS03_005920 [Exophiala xenobiotica]|nr:hypothetical protein LTS03_005920 [Exophiala xenobiotica]
MFFPWQRDEQTCPSNQNYYRCSSVPYSGCCSHDPCTTGHCTNDTVDSCAAPSTVTVTQTILHGAATSTLSPVDPSFPSSSAIFTFGAINLAQSSDTSASDTSLTATGLSSAPVPTVTPSVTSVTISSGIPTTKTVHLVSASATASSSPCPKPSSAASKATPSGTIAGGVIGGMAGLAMIVLLLLWCCGRRKRKFNFTLKRKTICTGEEDAPKDEEGIQQDRELALQSLEHNKHITSPRSFDFGLPRILQNATPIMPKQWR